jgi:hypothetical protein
MSQLMEIEQELERAKEDLQRDLDQVRLKADSEFMLPEHEIRRYPIASLCGALALGLAVGGERTPALLFGILALGAALILERPADRTTDGVKDVR